MLSSKKLHPPTSPITTIGALKREISLIASDEDGSLNDDDFDEEIKAIVENKSDEEVQSGSSGNEDDLLARIDELHAPALQRGRRSQCARPRRKQQGGQDTVHRDEAHRSRLSRLAPCGSGTTVTATIKKRLELSTHHSSPGRLHDTTCFLPTPIASHS